MFALHLFVIYVFYKHASVTNRSIFHYIFNMCCNMSFFIMYIYNVFESLFPNAILILYSKTFGVSCRACIIWMLKHESNELFGFSQTNYSRSDVNRESHPPPIKRLLSSKISRFKYNICKGKEAFNRRGV